VHYFNKPPLVNVEIDVEIDNNTFSDYEYMQRKTRDLTNNFGEDALRAHYDRQHKPGAGR
jgi:hypothetical protein